MIIKGKPKYIDKIVEELEKAGITLGNNYTTEGSDDHLRYIGGKINRYCHPTERYDLLAQFPSHRKKFVRIVKDKINKNKKETV